MTERNICDGKENVRDGKDILIYNNNYQHKSKHEVEYNTFNRAQSHSWCYIKVIKSVVVFTVTIII